MGEAKRRRSPKSQSTWFHGSSQTFKRWICPPPSNIEKPELLQHSFLSLTKERRAATKIGAYVCQTTVSAAMGIVDLRESSETGKAAWQRLQCHPLAEHFLVPDHYESYIEKCISGDILRPEIRDLNDAKSKDLSDQTAIAQGYGIYSETQRYYAKMQAQNAVRLWIETVIKCARGDLDAVICSERSDYADLTLLNLYVFSPDKLSSPLWS